MLDNAIWLPEVDSIVAVRIGFILVRGTLCAPCFVDMFFIEAFSRGGNMT